ncbi:hypothetical protein DFJ74DRAFT_707597 [Hyaloraphidium curvatum]|nr:hypothetical protein DFJ74DRAFT_707597 [Hyaloraphidium curvatum]
MQLRVLLAAIVALFAAFSGAQGLAVSSPVLVVCDSLCRLNQTILALQSQVEILKAQVTALQTQSSALEDGLAKHKHGYILYNGFSSFGTPTGPSCYPTWDGVKKQWSTCPV